MPATGAASAFDQGKDDVTELAAIDGAIGRFRAARRGALLAPDNGFVNFHSRAVPTKRRKIAGDHRGANAMSKEPSGFHAANEHPLNLASRNALLAGAHQVNDLEPKVQGQVRRLENGFHAHGEGLAAFVALDEPLASGLALHPAQAFLIGVAAMRANRAVRPKTALDISESGIFVLEVRGVEDGGSHYEA